MRAKQREFFFKQELTSREGGKQTELYIEAGVTFDLFGELGREDMLCDVQMTLMCNRRMRECSPVKYRILFL